MSPRFWLTVLVLTLLSPTLLTPATASADWPHLRSEAEDLPPGDVDLATSWRVSIGSGYSAVVVQGARAVTAFADGQGADVVAAFSTESGRELWRARLDRTYEGHSGSQDGPIATPTLAHDRVYMVSPYGVVAALSLSDGAEVWRRHLVDELGATEPIYGIGATPLVVDDVVVIETHIEGRGAVHGFDAATGELRWSAVDDGVGYQAPILAELSGRSLVVAITNHVVAGIEPSTGEVLWEARHAEGDSDGIAQPVVVRAGDAEGVLVTYWSDAARFLEVSRDGTIWTAEFGWETSSFGRNYAVPEPHEGRIYGLKGAFLHVVDAATGELVWRSRPPGASALELFGDKVVVVDRQGDVVVGDASGDAWREIARAPALDIDGLTAASYSGGRIFVRNLEHLAAVDVRSTTSTAQATARASDSEDADLPGILGILSARLGRAPDAAHGAILDQFLARRDLPIVETVDGATWVHFLWRGEADDVALSSAIFPRGQEPLRKLGESDLWVRSVELPDGGAWQYSFVVDLGDAAADPRNPRRLVTPVGERSWFSTPGWQAPEELRPTPPESWGRIETFQLTSEIRENDREVRLLLPPEPMSGDHRLLVVTDGDDALENGFGHLVDRLRSEGRLADVVVAFVPFAGWQETGFRETASFARMLVEELVPAVGERVKLAPGGHALFGPAGGSTGSLVAALRGPDVFGRVAALDLQSWDESEDLLRRVIREERSARPAVRLDWSTTGEQNLSLGRSSLTDRSWLPDDLAAAGVDVASVDFPGGPGYVSWRARFREIVLWLMPET